jgi:hypothetical protein
MKTIAFAAPRRRALATTLPRLFARPAFGGFVTLAIAVAPFVAAKASAQGVTFGQSAGGDVTGLQATGSASSTGPTAPVATDTTEPAGVDEAASDAEWAERDRMLGETNTLTGGSGILRLQHAQSGAVGQFRLGFVTEWFSAGFLCNSGQFTCPNPTGGSAITSDTLNHIGATMSLGMSLAKLGTGTLEGYASTSGYANSDTANRPTLLQVLGDTDFGLKAVWPLSRIFHFGGFTELWLINGTGSVGLDGSGTSAKFGIIPTFDLRGSDARTPLRFSANLFYSLDNTGDVPPRPSSSAAAPSRASSASAST